jgi:hypothetical protein
MPEFGRLIYVAVKQMEAEGRLIWNPDRDIWTRTAA